MRSKKFAWALFIVVLGLQLPSFAFAEDFTASVHKYPYRAQDQTVIGSPTWYTIQPKDTLLDIARRNGLGFNSVRLLYPKMDAWLPPKGKRIFVPTFFVLPPSKYYQIVINIPEMRLYYFNQADSTVQTYPIGIGVEGWECPIGDFYVNYKTAHPTWYVPASLQPKYGIKSMPPGPDNPLGDFIMKFSAGDYGLHGTSMPWGVGRLVSHGCIRLYPENISILYPQVPMKTRIELIYEPIKFGRRNGRIFVQSFPDVYNKIQNYAQYALDKLAQCPFAKDVDQRKFMVAISLQNGVPTDVTKDQIKDDSLKMVEITQ
ncbi:MAG: L,D-transpeptidase family protein [Syntrophobacteraceae bacterium]|nr:L,D-transpeptidase family protein [Syntrophobacteraceae bacterium]